MGVGGKDGGGRWLYRRGEKGEGGKYPPSVPQNTDTQQPLSTAAATVKDHL